MRLRRGISVIALVDGLRELHPELARPVRWPQLQAVFEREGIQVMKARIRRRAFVDGVHGIAVITLNSELPARIHTKVLLHEYGHVHLHLLDSEEAGRQLVACTKGDIREREADLFAALLWLGPEATPDHPVIAKLYARVDGPRIARKQETTQLHLPLAHEVRTEKPREFRPKRRAAPEKKRFDWSLAGKRALPGSSVGLYGVSHDAIRFDMKRGGKPLGFFHYDLGWIDVYDRMVLEQDGRRRSVMLKCGDDRAQQRLFVISTTDRRLYTFAEKERRRPGVKELDAQIERAQRRRAVERFSPAKQMEEK